MKKIAIYGAGGFGRETHLLIDKINSASHQWEFIGYFDDYVSSEVLGGIEVLNRFDQPLQLVVAIADPLVRRKIVDNIDNKYINFPTLIHPSANLERKELSIGKGTIIAAMNAFTTNITLGDHAIINLSCTIGHDVEIGNFCSLMPGVNVSGNVKIEDDVLVGTGAQILQNLTIYQGAIVGAGAVVTHDVAADTTVVGVPAKTLEK